MAATDRLTWSAANTLSADTPIQLALHVAAFAPWWAPLVPPQSPQALGHFARTASSAHSISLLRHFNTHTQQPEKQESSVRPSFMAEESKGGFCILGCVFTYKLYSSVSCLVDSLYVHELDMLHEVAPSFLYSNEMQDEFVAQACAHLVFVGEPFSDPSSLRPLQPPDVYLTKQSVPVQDHVFTLAAICARVSPAAAPTTLCCKSSKSSRAISHESSTNSRVLPYSEDARAAAD